MKKQWIIGSVFGAVAVTALGAVAGYQLLNDNEYAEVVSVQEVYKTVKTPMEQCRSEIVDQKKPAKDKHQIAGTVAGAVIGGVLGHQVGGGRGNDVATVGGAVAGGYAGNKIQENIQENNTEPVERKVCETVFVDKQEPNGYRVTYLLNGEQREVHLDHDPGRRILLENGHIVTDPAS